MPLDNAASESSESPVATILNSGSSSAPELSRSFLSTT